MYHKGDTFTLRVNAKGFMVTDIACLGIKNGRDRKPIMIFNNIVKKNHKTRLQITGIAHKCLASRGSKR